MKCVISKKIVYYAPGASYTSCPPFVTVQNKALDVLTSTHQSRPGSALNEELCRLKGERVYADCGGAAIPGVI